MMASVFILPATALWKTMCAWKVKCQSGRGTWYISAGDIAGECWLGEAHIATAGTCLGPTCPFGQELLHLERAVAFQGCNGPISRDVKPDICQSDIMASQGHIREI